MNADPANPGARDMATYVVWDPVNNRAFRGEFVDEALDADLLVRGTLEPEAPIAVRRAFGTTLQPFVWTTSGAIPLVSREVVATLRWLDATGWRTHPVTIADRPAEDYAALVVTGRCAPIDWDRTTVVLKDYPGGAFPIARGIQFQPTSWDGSDIFMAADDTAYIMVTHRLRDALARFTNVELTPTEDVEVPSYPVAEQ